MSIPARASLRLSRKRKKNSIVLETRESAHGEDAGHGPGGVRRLRYRGVGDKYAALAARRVPANKEI